MKRFDIFDWLVFMCGFAVMVGIIVNQFRDCSTDDYQRIRARCEQEGGKPVDERNAARELIAIRCDQ